MRYFFSLLLFVISYQVFAQQTPNYSLFFKDQYTINPAAAGLKDYAVFTLNHRQQWRGIEGAPKTNSVLFHLPVGDKVALGATVVNDVRGLLSTNSFDATVVYRLPLSSRVDQNIRFGLTAGVGMNSIDLTKLDNAALQDPALLNNLDSHLALRGKFGMAYNYKSFNLGVSLPSLFENSVLSQTEFADIVLDPLTNYLAYANIRIPIGDKFAFEPTVIYRNQANGTQFEGAGIFHAMNVIWLGASYRQNSGIIGLFGITVSDRIDFGYAYEMASNQVNGFTNGSHEIQLSIRVGKKKVREKKKAKEKTPPPVEEEQVVVAPVIEILPEPIQNIIDSLNQGDNKVRVIFEEEVPERPEETEVTDRQEEVIVEPVTEPEQAKFKPAVVTRKGNHPFELDTGHFIVVGAFGSQANAIRFNDKLLSQRYDSDFGFSSDKQLFYVYISGENNAEGARKKRDELRKIPAYKNAWYLYVED